MGDLSYSNRPAHTDDGPIEIPYGSNFADDEQRNKTRRYSVEQAHRLQLFFNQLEISR